MSRYAIKLAAAITLAGAAAFGAFTLALKEAATFSEVLQKAAPESRSEKEQSRLEASASHGNGVAPPAVTKTSLQKWEATGEDKIPEAVAITTPDPPSQISIASPGNVSNGEDKTALSRHIKNSKTEIVAYLSSPRVKMTREAVNKIYNKSIMDSFLKASNPPYRFEALSGNLKIQRAPAKGPLTVNLYEIGAALGGSTYLCISSAKLDCFNPGQTGNACAHSQNVMLQNCVDKAMESVEGLILRQAQKEAS